MGLDDGEREILVAATAEIPELRGVVERAAQRAELRGLCGTNNRAHRSVDRPRYAAVAVMS